MEPGFTAHPAQGSTRWTCCPCRDALQSSHGIIQSRVPLADHAPHSSRMPARKKDASNTARAVQDQLFCECVCGVGRLRASGFQGFPLLADGLSAHSHSGLPLGKG